MIQKISAKVILLVDDDLDWHALVRAALQPRHKVRSVFSGEHGVESARAGRPDLIVLDVFMPGGEDGLSTLCRLKKDPETKTIPVLIMSEINAVSGLSYSSDVIKRQLGFDELEFAEKRGSVKYVRRRISHSLKMPTDSRTDPA